MDKGKSVVAELAASFSDVLVTPREPPEPQAKSFLPSPSFFTKFARETGDTQTLSDVDINIIALAYMLEAEIHGTSHLREHPPPLKILEYFL
ncbi:RNA-binding protein NOB1 [Zea mays]|uniref:RNA-binding protein NOB1 n=1 Tax=Zea mays TaxID=4577 RepID=UPI0004DE8898|nr:RNA-binding protein NOB1 [Zea mays]|eukprot:XP_008659443.1 RNA-binding protein NOB1 [Zea mays]